MIVAKKPSRSSKPASLRQAEKKPEELRAISKIALNGFKSISGPKAQEIQIAPLTVLAGANSSGKSSVMQPILLLKQTIEASYDPGPLLLHGPHVRLTSTKQITPIGNEDSDFIIGLELNSNKVLTLRFRASSEHTLSLVEMTHKSEEETLTLTEELSSEAIRARLPKAVKWVVERPLWSKSEGEPEFHVTRARCFFEIGVLDQSARPDHRRATIPMAELFELFIQKILHLPGLRGSPERSYPVSATGPYIPGTFEPYVASVILDWQRRDDPKLQQLNKAIAQLGLSWKIEAKQIDASAVELKVGRLPKSKNGGHDLVNIADVGFGVSQALPVVVADARAAA